MISEKLVNKVLGIHINKVQIHNLHNKDNELNINGKQHNIHELAHKCKEWALQYKYELLSGYLSGNGYVVVQEQRRTWYADTEPEAIFKACESILEQKEKP